MPPSRAGRPQERSNAAHEPTACGPDPHLAADTRKLPSPPRFTQSAEHGSDRCAMRARREPTPPPWKLSGAWRRIEAPPVPAGQDTAAKKQTGRRKEGAGEVYGDSFERRHFRVLSVLGGARAGPSLGYRTRSGGAGRGEQLQRRSSGVEWIVPRMRKRKSWLNRNPGFWDISNPWVPDCNRGRGEGCAPRNQSVCR
jgi:hypothetical protein